MLIKKILVFICLIVVFSLAAVGCKAKENGVTNNGKSITIAGSTSVQPLSEELVKAYNKVNPDILINVQGGGSSQGIKAAVDGIAEIGSSSRELKDAEKDADLKEFIIAIDGIAVVVHPQNELSNLSIPQIRDIFSGKITNWRELGGKEGPIYIVTREAGSGTRGAFQEIVMGENTRISDKAVTQPSNGAIRTTVAGNPNSIGFLSIGFLGSEIKAIKVDNVDATEENIKNKTYQIGRNFLYLIKGEPREEVKEYIDFVLSPQGQEIVGKDYIKAI